jgi:hypothetical protein
MNLSSAGLRCQKVFRASRALLETPDGLKVKKVLDRFMPMSQCIVARKPA